MGCRGDPQGFRFFCEFSVPPEFFRNAGYFYLTSQFGLAYLRHIQQKTVVRHDCLQFHGAPLKPTKKGTADFLVTFSNAAEVSCRTRAGEAWPVVVWTICPNEGSSATAVVTTVLGVQYAVGFNGRIFTIWTMPCQHKLLILVVQGRLVKLWVTSPRNGVHLPNPAPCAVRAFARKTGHPSTVQPAGRIRTG
jgi:hypothetical protein